MEVHGRGKEIEMKKMVTIHLIRHGYAEHNHGKDTYGTRAYLSNKYRFSRLMSAGKSQANDLRDLIENSGIVVDRIYISPLDRALETASIIFPKDSPYDRSHIFVTDDLRELNYSHPCNERKTVSILRLSYPDFDYSLMKSNRDILFIDGDTYDRCVSLIKEIKEYVKVWYCSGSKRLPNIVLVSHESFLLELARNYLGVDFKSIGNCEIITCDIDLNDVL